MMHFPVPDGAWESESHWYERTLLSEDVSAILDGIDPSHTLSRDFFIAQVPDPFSNGRWSRAKVYDYVLEKQPSTTYTAIPRLYPAPDHRGTPGRLMFTQAIEVDPGGQEVVVYIWDPADDRGHIAIAFPIRDSRGAPPADTACRLLALLPTATAVVIPDDEYIATPQGQRRKQPAIWVAEGRQPAAASPHTWGDVANLLRTTLPWWSFGIRDRDAMLAWRPGDKPVAIPPGTAHRDPTALQAVLASDSSAALRATVDIIAGEIEHDLCGSYREHFRHDQFNGNHGLQQAATADMDYRTPRPSRTAGQIALFLHQQVANPIAAASARRRRIPDRSRRLHRHTHTSTTADRPRLAQPAPTLTPPRRTRIPPRAAIPTARDTARRPDHPNRLLHRPPQPRLLDRHPKPHRRRHLRHLSSRTRCP